MSDIEDDEDSLEFYLKNKENNNNNNNNTEEKESEIEKDKKEEEEIFNRYEKIGNLTDIKSIKESEMTKNYDEQGNKYYNEYKYLKLLGKGAYSKVKLVMKDNEKYAMKIINKKELKKRKIFKQDNDGNVVVTNLLKDSLKEIAILKKLNHPNIIKLYEILHNYQKEKIYLIMEYAEYGDIVDYNEQNGVFSINKHIYEIYNKIKDKEKSFNETKYYKEEDIRSFCKNIVLGLDYLHKNGIIHHDIKPNNILLCKKGICKITDFNFSSILDNLNNDNIRKNVDSADNFKAPETIFDQNELENNDNDNNDNNDNKDLNNEKKDNNDNKSFKGKPLDIWALGVTLYIMAYLKFPFYSDKGIIDLYNIIKHEKVKFPDEPFYSRKLKFLIEKCLEKDPEKRKTTDEILKMCVLHKFECIDKYKPIFNKKKVEIEISVEELCMTLDFFHNECNAVFENPSDKAKPIVYRYKKNLIKFELPKDRSLNKVTIKQNIKYIPVKPIFIKPIEKEKKKSEKKLVIVQEKSPVVNIPSNVIIRATITEKIIGDDDKNPIIEKKVITINKDGKNINEEIEKIINNIKKIDGEKKVNEEDGKVALQKYIDEK